MANVVKKPAAKNRSSATGKPLLVSTLSDIVATYQRDHSAFPAAERRHFSGLSLAAAIEQAALCQTPDNKRHPHQHRLKQETLDDFYVSLNAKASSINDCQSFNELFSIVKNARVTGIGELTVYDVAHRIGMQRNLAPEKVYLHAGTRSGAKALKLPWQGREAVEMSELPLALQRAGAEAAEDILCLFKDRFRTLLS